MLSALSRNPFAEQQSEGAVITETDMSVCAWNTELGMARLVRRRLELVGEMSFAAAAATDDHDSLVRARPRYPPRFGKRSEPPRAAGCCGSGTDRHSAPGTEGGQSGTGAS